MLDTFINVLVLGTSGFLALGWLWKRRQNQVEEREKNYKDLTQKIIDLLEEQYDEHLRNPETDPWIAINHIRDMLIPTHERLVVLQLFFCLDFLLILLGKN